MISIILLVFIYLIVYKSSEGENKCPYVPKRIKTSGIRGMISSMMRWIHKLGGYIIDHADSITIIKKKRHIQRRNNLSNK